MTERVTSDMRLVALLQRLASTPRLLVALDFDGTVSPFVDDPYAARVIPEAAASIARLAALPRTWVAFVSGRPLESLVRVTESDENAFLIGSHGAEVRLHGDDVAPAVDDDERRRLDELGAALSTLVAEMPGSMLEHKPLGFGVHTRSVDPMRVAEVHAESRAAAGRVGGFLARDGKDILEFAVRDSTKGDGIEYLRARVDASAVLFAGDDVTDEDGFAVMQADDLGVKVGEGPTRATHRVADVHEMAEVLRLLAAERVSQVSAQSWPTSLD